MRIIGLDFRLKDVSEIKGIAKCLINFDFGNFESCSYNCNNNQSGGLFSVSVVADDTNSMMIGNLVITVISTKKLFEVLCDGSCEVDFVSGLNLAQKTTTDTLFPTMFNVLGTQTVEIDMFYRNKGPTRIKAGKVKIIVSVIDLSNISESPKPHIHCKLDKDNPPNITAYELYILMCFFCLTHCFLQWRKT